MDDELLKMCQNLDGGGILATCPSTHTQGCRGNNRNLERAAGASRPATYCLAVGSTSWSFSRTLTSSLAASRYLSTFLMIFSASTWSLKEENDTSTSTARENVAKFDHLRVEFLHFDHLAEGSLAQRRQNLV